MAERENIFGNKLPNYSRIPVITLGKSSGWRCKIIRETKQQQNNTRSIRQDQASLQRIQDQWEKGLLWSLGNSQGIFPMLQPPDCTSSCPWSCALLPCASYLDTLPLARLQPQPEPPPAPGTAGLPLPSAPPFGQPWTATPCSSDKVPSHCRTPRIWAVALMSANT